MRVKSAARIGDMDLSPVSLTGRLVRLEPLSLDHHDGLVEGTQDGQMWDR